MEISVIVPSYNGAERLPNVLDALVAQSYIDFELLVVLDGSTDDSAEVVKAYPQAHVLIKENGGRASARNHGAREAKGNILLFFDDDMRPLPEVVARHLAFHHEHADRALVGSQQTDPNKYTDELGRYHCHMEAKYLATADKPGLHPMPEHQDYITAAHFSIAADLFWKFEGFDDRLTDLEDFDLAMRMHDAGQTIWRDESLIAWHDNVNSPEQLVLRQREYYTALERLHKLKPDLTERRKAWNLHTHGGARKLLMNFWARCFWLRQVGKPGLLRLLPEGLRFRLYERIIYGLVNYFPGRRV